MGKFLRKHFSLIPPVICGIIYFKTLLPDVDFWDTGEFQTIGYTFDIAHPTGYPLYIILLKIFNTIFPLGNIAFRANLLSTVFASLGLYFLAKTIQLITKNLILSTFIPIILGTNPFLWSIAIRADPHTLHFLLVSLFIYLDCLIIVKKKYKLILALSIIFGLSVTNHLLSIFLLPSFIITLIIIKIPPKNKALSLFVPSIFFLLFYLTIPIIYHSKGSFTIDYNLNDTKNLIRYILGQDFNPQGFLKINNQFFLNLKDSFELLNKNLGTIVILTSNLGLLILIVKERFGLILLPLFLFNLSFSANYHNAIIERYYITNITLLYLSLAYLLGIIINKTGSIIRKTQKVWIFAINFLIGIFLITLIEVSISQNYAKIDQSKNHSARRWATSVLENLEPNAVIFSWWSYSTPLWYLQKVEKIRPDILIINDSQNKWEEKAKEFTKIRPVYFIENINLNDESLKLVRKENVFKVGAF